VCGHHEIAQGCHREPREEDWKNPSANSENVEKKNTIFLCRRKQQFWVSIRKYFFIKNNMAR
jgi:hypothetical protein